MYEPYSKEIEDSIRNHLMVFQSLVARSAAYLNKRQYENAGAYAQLAAGYAWGNHPGLFVSSQLEGILLTIGRHLTDQADIPKQISSKPRLPQRLLHVFTEAFVFGGHTRLACKWIQEDSSRTHSVALTRQGRRSLPEKVKDAVSARNGKIYFLDERPGGLLSRARLLREIAQSADQIVLHTHPYDVVPMIAFADRNSPPVIFMNHADHVFWIGIGGSDVIAHVRESGLRTSLERRGAQPERCTILPIPLLPQPRTLSRSEAREKLGLNGSDVVLLTVASEYKYQISSETSFVEALLPVLYEQVKAVLLAVGPTNSGPWASGKDKTQGRVKAYGFQEDPSLFYQAADLYLDSFPFSSITSLLEAACYGVPVISYHMHPDAASVLQADDPALKDKMISFSNLDQYRNTLLRLIDDERIRLDLGESIKKSVLDIHAGVGWMRFLEQTYLQAVTISPATRSVPAEETSISDLDRALSWMHINSGISQGLDATVREHSRLLPFRSRVRVWANMCKEKRSLLPFYLLPESVGTEFERKIWR